MTIDTAPSNSPAPSLPTAIESSPVPFDLYREVHKGLRLALFRLVSAAGAADFADAAARSSVTDQVHAVIGLLHAHHGHEDVFVQPIIEAHARHLAAVIDEGHLATEQDLVEIEYLTDRLSCSDGAGATVAGLDLYLALAAFTSRYMAHMAQEEGEVMTTLRSAMTVEELFAVEMAIRSTVAPPTMCKFIAVMVPAMNIDERTDMLGGMRAGAPPEIFELFRCAAEAALDSTDYHAVAVRIGLA